MLEEKIKDAIGAELVRQAEERPSELEVGPNRSTFAVRGKVDLLALAAAIAGAVSGGP